MLTVYCPACWAGNPEGASRCRRCGQALTGEGGPPAYVEKLLQALHHPEPKTPRRAAWILGELRAIAAVAPLVRLLDECRDPYILEEAARALGKIGSARATPALSRLLRAGPLRARVAAASALAGIGGQEAEEALQEAARDPNRAVRRAADSALVQIRARGRP